MKLKVGIFLLLIVGLVFFFWPGYPPNQFLQKILGRKPISQLTKTGEEKLKNHQTPPNVTLEIEPSVDPDDAAKLAEGIRVMDYYLHQWFSRGTKQPVLMTVDTSTENSLLVGRNGVMVALLHTNEPLWQQFRQYVVQYGMDMRSRFAAHEYVHYYQQDAGCGRVFVPEEVSIKWLMEAEAEWLSYRALNEAGQLPLYLGLEKMLAAFYQQNKMNLKPLKTYEKETLTSPATYSYYALALELLMKNNDVKAIDNFCAFIGEKNPPAVAFEKAFGIPLEKFYSDFEAYRQNP